MGREDHLGFLRSVSYSAYQGLGDERIVNVIFRLIHNENPVPMLQDQGQNYGAPLPRREFAKILKFLPV